jgi:glycosyltransferase involved in cell wall biosynthesis
MPYDIAGYDVHGSGILMESAASGVPVVGPFSTLPGRIVEEYGIGTLFMECTEDAIFDAVLAAHRDFARYAQAAFQISRRWRQVHGTDQLAAALLRAYAAA